MPLLALQGTEFFGDRGTPASLLLARPLPALPTRLFSQFLLLPYPLLHLLLPLLARIPALPLALPLAVHFLAWPAPHLLHHSIPVLGASSFISQSLALFGIASGLVDLDWRQ